MNNEQLAKFMENAWEKDILPTLTDYIRIPNKSPAFDPKWVEHGHMDKVVAMFEAWAREKVAKLPGAKLEVVRLPKRTPLILIEVPGKKDDTVLLYGHMDKQPEMKGWADGTGPWEPVRKGDKLFGRGGADDGYAMFAAISALLALEEQKIPHARAVIVIEACEESGSYDLPYYIEHLSDRIGTPSLVVCLDSGCGNYDQLWLTTSLRGIAMGNLTVRVLTEGVHSGDASGVVPSSFRIVRQLLSRIENENTGEVTLQDLYVQVPPDRIEQAKQAAKILGDELYTKFPFAGGTEPVTKDLSELVLNRTWRPQLAVVGMDGYPSPEDAGNVLLPYSTAKLSMRLPPTCNADAATASMKKAFEDAAPDHAEVEFHAEAGQGGWNAPKLAPWLEKSLAAASQSHFGAPTAFMGEGGSIPFMAMLGAKYPKTQFVVTGVLGPHSNAHGPNEFLHIPTAKKVSACVAQVLADHAAS
ncbi:MAG TPA: M20 family metallopeptidase [Rhizomicrobium sp.]|jgi:acetylornithine deacetylase/succinyl-diaminopimelate desuccinylase-like protein|nr:M20 family metallopeptidase [Rhizomicrobium sp.]